MYVNRCYNSIVRKTRGASSGRSDSRKARRKKMNKTFRVEFNETGYYSGQGIWTALEETTEVKAETAEEAVELIIEWMIDESIQYNPDNKTYDQIEKEIRNYAWRAAEEIKNEYGIELGEWKNV